MIQLQVMICTFGEDGIQRVANSSHPIMPDVEYIVGWQLPDGDVPIPEELKRQDFKIYKHSSTGLSKNRNYLLEKATADLLLISDDDVEYTPQNLIDVINAFNNHPDSDILTFKYSSLKSTKFYPDKSFNLRKPEKGYYCSSIEIAFRRSSIQNVIKFNERFGIGGIFMTGEEDLFLNDCIHKGLHGTYIPLIIASHNHLSTSERECQNPKLIQAKGGIFIHLYPYSWIARMFVHGLRNISHTSFTHYIKNWIKGAFKELKFLYISP